jgi:hypothetical protein
MSLASSHVRLCLTCPPGATGGKEASVSRAAVVASTVVRPCIAPLRVARCCCCCRQAGQCSPVVALKLPYSREAPAVCLNIRRVPAAPAAAGVASAQALIAASVCLAAPTAATHMPHAVRSTRNMQAVSTRSLQYSSQHSRYATALQLLVSLVVEMHHQLHHQQSPSNDHSLRP